MKEFLSQNGVEWTEKYVDMDRTAAVEMIRRSGQTGVPVTVIGDEVVVGFDRPRLQRIVTNLKATAAQGGNQSGGKKSLGAKVADASKYALAGGTPMQGAYVGGVNPGSPAEAAGLRTGDIIIAVNDRPIGSVNDLASALAAIDGTPATLTLRRGANSRQVEVRL